MNAQTTARLAGASMAFAAGLAIAGFTALGSIFDYPQILENPTSDILALFRENQGAVVGWFLALVVSAALLAPAGVLLGRLSGGRLGRWIAAVGVAAATVQVVGLQRWVTLVPGISRDALDPAGRKAAEERFELLHLVLGKLIGETLGYALTATFTVLAVIALTRIMLPSWLAILGYTSAALIATGVVIPIVPAASLPNFAGYVAWCVWLLGVAVILFRINDTQPGSPSQTGRGGPGPLSAYGVAGRPGSPRRGRRRRAADRPRAGRVAAARQRARRDQPAGRRRPVPPAPAAVRHRSTLTLCTEVSAERAHRRREVRRASLDHG